MEAGLSEGREGALSEAWKEACGVKPRIAMGLDIVIKTTQKALALSSHSGGLCEHKMAANFGAARICSGSSEHWA